MRAWLYTGTETPVTDFGNTMIEVAMLRILMLPYHSANSVMDCLDFAAESKENYYSLFATGE